MARPKRFELLTPRFVVLTQHKLTPNTGAYGAKSLSLEAPKEFLDLDPPQNVEAIVPEA